MADVKVTLKRVIDAQGNTDNIHPTTDWDQVENKPSTFTPTAHTLNSHTDVDANPTAAGQVLTWDADNSQWIASVSAGGGVSKADLQNVYIYGKADGAITKGQAIQFAGAQGGHILIKAAVPSEINAEPTLMIGIAETDLANNEFGYVIIYGRLNLDTSVYEAGDLLYFASAGSTAGALTTTEPTDPNASIQMAAVSVDGVGNGEFIIRNKVLTRQINEVIGLQGALDSKVNKSGDTMSGALNIGGATVADASLHIKESFGGFDRLTQINPSGASKPALNLMASTNSSSENQWFSWGVDTGNLFKIQPGTSFSGSTGLFVLSNGNVGVGTDSPVQKLDVNTGASSGGIKITANNTYNSQLFFYNESTLRSAITSIAGGNLAFYHNGGDKLVIDNSGNVGIGTTSPGHKLDISTSDTIPVKITGTSTSGTGIYLDNDRTGSKLFGILVGNTGAGDFSIKDEDAGVDRLVIKSDGNVGIGTTSPSTKLEVQGGRLRVDGGTEAGVLEIGNDTKTNYIFTSEKDLYIRTDASDADIILQATGTQGNVGIGTDNPTSKLHISGDARVEGDLTVNGTMTVVDTDVNTTEQWIVTNDGTGPAAIINQTGAQPVIDIQDDGVSAFYIEDGGNVGIGTTDPGYKLDVNGAIHSTGNVYGTSGRGVIRDNSLENHFTNADSDVAVNYVGYLEGTTRFRDFNIWNGKAGFIAKFQGSTGNVGIGTESPGSKLDVSGDIAVSGTVDGVDVSAFKTAYDGHTHDDRYYTETESDDRFLKDVNYDLDLSGLDQSTYYPVTIGIGDPTTLKIEVRLNSGTIPSWSTHPSGGFSLLLHWTSNGNGWGTVPVERRIHQWTESYTNGISIVGGITQMSFSSLEVVYLRGGGKYFLRSSEYITPTIRTSSFTQYGQTVAPTTTVVNNVYQQAAGTSSYNRLIVNDQIGIGTTSVDGALHSMGRINLHQSGAGGGQNRFAGVEASGDANGRAQFIMSSAYSDLVIASSQANDVHGSTLTFAAYNPANAAEHRKFVINQGGWGARLGFLEFGYEDASNPNPHSNISDTDTVMTLDGVNKRVGIGTRNPGQKLDVNGFSRFRDTMYFGSSDEQGVISWNANGFVMHGLSGKGMAFGANGVNNHMYINTSGNVGIGDTNPSEKLVVNGGIIRKQQRGASHYYPLGHYTPGDTVFEIDPTWSTEELQAFFGNGTAFTWLNDITAPGGYAIRIDGAPNIGGVYGTGPYIPVDVNDVFYMECWIRSVEGSKAHYMGSIDFNENFGSLGGNPGSFGYWVMSNRTIDTNWTKVSGYISGFGSSVGQFRPGTKYWTPQALFNYTNISGVHSSVISGFKVIKVTNTGNRIFQDKVGVNTDLNLTGDLTVDATNVGGQGSPVNSSNSGIVLKYQAGPDIGDYGAGISFDQRWWTGSSAVIGTGQISGVKTAGNGSFGGGLAFMYTPSSGANAYTEGIRLNHLGRVGIGTTNPSTMLHISSPSNTAIKLTETNGDSTAFVEMGESDSFGVKLKWDGASNTFFKLSTIDNGTEADRFAVDRYGDVGIGTTAPTAKLDVAGEIKATNIHDWQWRWIRYQGLVNPGNSSGGAMELWFRTYFLKTTEAPEGSGYLDTRTQVGDEGGFGGSTYGNMFGDLNSYHTHIYTEIYVDREFSVSVTNFSGDDPYALFINEKFVQGNSSCCTDMSYSYTFKRGWHKIDLVYSEGGGGDWVRLGWNPKNYTSYITVMNPYSGVERTIDGFSKFNGDVSIIGSTKLYMGESLVSGVNGWATRQYANGSNHQFNAQSFGFNNDGYGSTWNATIDSSGMSFGGNGRTLYGPNSTWSAYLSVGGNGYNGNATTASMAVTSGNLHLDAATGFGTYLNFYAGTAGTLFGNGSNGVVAVMGADGDLWKGSADNSGVKYTTQTDYASATTGGTVKMRVDGTTLYIRNDGTNA
jgi:hypothetical protein